MKKTNWTYKIKTNLSTITFVSLLCVTSIVVKAESTSSNTKEVSEHLTTITPAKALKRPPPEYPRSAAIGGSEGWVKLSYVINEQGKVKDVIVMDSGGDRSFRRSAKNALSRWSFTPAKNQQNENITSCKNSVQLDFRMSNGGASRKFVKLLKASFDALKEKNEVELEKYITKMDQYKNKNFDELAWSEYIKMLSAILKGDEKQAYAKAQKSAQSISTFSESASLDILQNLIRFQISRQLYHNVKQNYKKLDKYDSKYAKSVKVFYQPYIEEINALIETDKHIAVKGGITESYWHHQLVRSSFSIENIEGELYELDVRCDQKHSSFSIKADDVFTIPKSWGECSLFIKGEKNATFDLFEISAKV